MESTFVNRIITMVLLTLYFLLVPAFGNETNLRLVSTCPAITEILYYLQLGDNVVGVSNQCDYPKEVKNKAKCAGMSINLEKIISLKPDSVLMMKNFRNGEESLLKSASLNVIPLNLSNVKGIVSSIKLLGKKFNRNKLAKKFENSLKKLQLNISKRKDKKPLVYIEIWGNPIMSVGGTSFISDIVKIAGGVNIFSKNSQENIEVSPETILMHNPDIIIIAYPEKNIKNICKRALFKNISAVKNHKVYKINPDLIVRPGPRILEGISKLNNLFNNK